MPHEFFAPKSISILAPSPAAFSEARYIPSPNKISYSPWTITNHGLRIEGLPIVEGLNALKLLKSAGYSVATDKLYVIALIGCCEMTWNRGGGNKPFEEVGIVLNRYKGKALYYRPRNPEALLHLESSIKTSARLD
jgi:hypothetical protein